MKNPRILTSLLVLFPLWLYSQSFQFNLLNTHFVLIPGGGFETRAWVEVPMGDTVYLTAQTGPGLHAHFQPAKVIQNQFVYLVVISTDSSLAQMQSLQLVARHMNDSIVQNITVENHNNGHGFYLIDSARYYQDTVFHYLMEVYDASAGLLDSVRQLDWIPCFPYPPLLVVTHHLFVHDDWRNTVLWHNMVPPHNWVKVFVYNEVENICFGVFIDTWGKFTTIHCEIMHYNFQDTITSRREFNPEAEFSIFPNPTSEFLQIAAQRPMPQSTEISLFNLSGVRVIREVWPEHASSITCNIGSLPAGAYILSVAYCDGQWQRLIIKH